MNLSLTYGILISLINKRKMRREELATRFNVAPRTVQRYVEALAESGVPVLADSGPNGGYYIPDEYKMSYVLFTAEELSRIRICTDALEGGFKDDITRSAIEKMSALASSTQCSRITPLFIDFDAWNGTTRSMQSRFDAVSAAITNRLTVSIDYTDKLGASGNRLLDPYTLALKEGIWYVYGKCHVHNEYRLFRLARMNSIELTDKTFYPEECDVKSALGTVLGDTFEMELSFTRRCLAGIEEWLGTESITKEASICHCKAVVGDGDDLVRKLLSFGSDVKVVSPESLRERVKAEAKKIIEG